MMRLVPVSALLLAACGPSADEVTPPPVTQAETDALEDAASMLDEQRMPVQEARQETRETEGENQ